MSVKQKFFLCSLVVTAFYILPLFSPIQLTSVLGINTYAAHKVIDIVSTAGTVYAVVGIVAAVIGGGGIGVAALATAKILAKRYGKAAAAAW